MSAIVIGEGLIHYEAIGRGRPVVFIHGWLGSWRYWMPTMEELSSGYRAYALDLWGFGDSDKRGRVYSITAYIELLNRFLDKLGVVRPTLVGHALGGMVALLCASQAANDVEQVVGVSVPLTHTAVNRPLASVTGSGDVLARLAGRRVRFPEVEMGMQKADAVDLHRMLPSIGVPVLLVHGKDDSLVKLPEEEWLRNCGDNMRAIFMDGTRHFPMLEERNKFNRLLKDFLEAGDDLASLELKEEWQRRLR
jgi:pimeloyl-ACP methyl ester carboxylesterase